MTPKKSTPYQHAEIIIDRMIKKSGLSQNKFARDVLGIAGGNISEARKTGKIPDRWFEVMEDKYGVTKEDLCKDLPRRSKIAATIEPGNYTSIVSAPAMPYGDASKEQERQHCLQEFDSLYRLILQWQEDEYGLDSVTSMDFIREFHERFPELGNWLKKRKGADHQTLSHKSIGDGTDGKK